PNLGRAQLRQVPANEGEAVSVRRNQQSQLQHQRQETNRAPDPMSYRRAQTGVVTGKLVLLKFGNRALDLIDQLFALIAANHRADIAALPLGVDFRLCGGAYPALNIGAYVAQEPLPPRRVSRQNGEISMVAVEIFNRPAIGFEKAVVISEE